VKITAPEGTGALDLFPNLVVQSAAVEGRHREIQLAVFTSRILPDQQRALK
jgi:hypothetical protein